MSESELTRAESNVNDLLHEYLHYEDYMEDDDDEAGRTTNASEHEDFH